MILLLLLDLGGILGSDFFLSLNMGVRNRGYNKV